MAQVLGSPVYIYGLRIAQLNISSIFIYHELACNTTVLQGEWYCIVYLVPSNHLSVSIMNQLTFLSCNSHQLFVSFELVPEIYLI